jgi:xanthine dehydrogenase YagR molybdenum-binding subunit
VSTATRSIGTPVDRIEGREKVSGAARYAFEHNQDNVAYAVIVQSEIAHGTVRHVDAGEALALDGVVAVLHHGNAPQLPAAGELAVLQSADVAYRGQIVAAVVADELETAQQAAGLVRVGYHALEHDVVLRADHPGLYAPEKVNPNFPTDTAEGDVEAALAGAAVVVDRTYTTPAEHNNAMEPHATVAIWDDQRLTLYDSTQGAWRAAQTLAEALGLDADRVRVVSHHVGGGFGSKGTPRPHSVLAAICARETGRPVKLAVTRRQMFTLTGYRTPTIQRLRLGAERDGTLVGIAHDVAEQTSQVQEFAEQTAVVTRMMYASPARRTTHRVVALNVPTPSWMRAPGECPSR